MQSNATEHNAIQYTKLQLDKVEEILTTKKNKKICDQDKYNKYDVIASIILQMWDLCYVNGQLYGESS